MPPTTSTQHCSERRTRLASLTLAALAVCSSNAAGVFASSPGGAGATQASQAPSASHDPAAKVLERMRWEQRLDHAVPLDLSFRDETGRAVQLRDLVQEKPVLVTLVYFECPMLCTQVLNGLVKGLKPVGLTPGDDFEILTISIDPKDTPELAAKKKANYLRLLGDESAGKGWHFLVGDQSAIDAVSDAVGFRYFFDPAIQEFAHPAGAVVLTPTGHVSRYLFDIDFPPRDLRLSLVEASQNKIGTLLDQMYLRCYHWDPQTGKYGLAISSVLRVFGTLTVLAIASLIYVLLRRERRQRRALSLQAPA